MDARDLGFALALAEQQHFGRAAAALGIAQPHLSRRIAELEREVGVALFDRTRRGVFPTAAGAALLDRAGRVMREMSAAATDARRAARGETGRLRLGFISSALPEFLPRVLPPFRRDHPDVRLDLSEMASPESTAALIRGELDVAIGRGGPRGVGVERLTSVAVDCDHMVAAVHLSHPFAGQASVTRDQLRGQHLIGASPQSEPVVHASLGVLVDADGAPAAPGAYTEAWGIFTVLGLVACGAGVGLLPSCVRAAARPDVIWLCEVVPRVATAELVLSHRADDCSPVVAAFVREVGRHARGSSA